MNAQSQKETAEQVLFGVISDFWLARSIGVAAEIGAADHIDEEPVEIDQLAQETRTERETLYRLMRALASAGYFREHDGRRFSHTELSWMLRSDIAGSMRYAAISELGSDHYQAWEHLGHSIRTGATAFERRFGMSVWQYYEENPEIGETFERSMTGLTQRVHEALLASWDFGRFRCILDVGGGQGSLMASILRNNPEATGITMDRPDVAKANAETCIPADLAERMRIVGGDFFESVPEGADLQILKWILHDWPDDLAVRILWNCRRSIGRGGKLVLIEAVVPPANEGILPKLLDLNMLVMTGGRERTAEEFEVLLKRAGFRLQRVIQTSSPVSILEADPV